MGTAKRSPMAWVAGAIVLYHFIVVGHLPTYLGMFLPGQIHGAISLGLACLIIFLKYGATQSHLRGVGAKQDLRLRWYDIPFVIALATSVGFIVFFFDTIQNYGMFGFLDKKGVVIALLLCTALLESLRRATGIILPVVILVFVALTIFQPYLPGLLYGQGYDFDRLLYSAFVGESGIFGLPLRVASTLVIVFLVFGSVMQRMGAGQWVIDLAMSLTGWSRGGPAKASVLSSALFGSISGSPSANAATTGVFTIPLMTSLGYRPAFAGAVEAVASTGGQILPPVMGAIAFIMAEWIGVPYAELALAAALPAILYFAIVFASVHFQAHRDRVVAMPRSELPFVWPVFRRGWFYGIPMVALMYFLIVRAYPPGLAGIYSVGIAMASSFLSRDRTFWLTPRTWLDVCHDSVMRWVAVAVITGSVGIMVGALELSGVGIKLSSFLVELAGGDLVLTLLLVGMASLLLGMGLDSLPAYVTLATLMAPALVKLGVPVIAAHLFVVYWGLASFFTPPLCIAVYIVITISGSGMWETGWEAMRLGIASFLIPFAFVLNPALLLRGEPGEILQAFTTALVGAVLLAAGIRGYALGRLSPLARLSIGAGGLLFIAPGLEPLAAGIVLVLAAFAIQWVVRPDAS